MWLETQRLILREFQREDVRELAPILSHPQSMRFSLTGVLSELQTQQKIEKFIATYEKYGFGKWAVILKESQELIGYCGIGVEQIDHQDEREIGYRLDYRFWGQGLATEAATAVVRCGFERFNFPYILGIVERENTASVRILEKLGMHFVRETIFHGVNMDVYQLSLRQ